MVKAPCEDREEDEEAETQTVQDPDQDTQSTQREASIDHPFWTRYITDFLSFRFSLVVCPSRPLLSWLESQYVPAQTVKWARCAANVSIPQWYNNNTFVLESRSSRLTLIADLKGLQITQA